MHGGQAPRHPHPFALFFTRAWVWLLFGALFLVVGALTLRYELELPSATHTAHPFEWTPEQRDRLLVAFLGAGTLCAAGQALSTSSAKLRTFFQSRVLTVLLAAIVFSAGVVYFYGAHGAKHAFSHLHDSYHYFIGAKYYAELGYDGLYECSFEALGPKLVPNNTRIRDLRTDEHTKVGRLRQEGAGARCKQAFTPERWEEFQRDLQVFSEAHPRSVSGALSDRGYNGSPFHTFVAQAVANAVPFSYRTLSLWVLIDVFSVCVALAALCQGFGVRPGLLVALLFFCQFADRFQIIGGSFLRYQWFLALCLGLSFLKRERFFLAGLALTVSAFFNVFPVLFCLPLALWLGISLVRQRSFGPSEMKLVQGASLAALLCALLGAAHGHGFQNYTDFRDAMRVHNAAGRAPGLAVGLKVNFVSASRDGNHSTSVRSRELKESRGAIIAAATLISLAALYVATQVGLAEGAILVGFTGLFCIFGPTGYYFLFAPLFLLVWSRKTWDSGGLWMQALFFALSIPPYLVLLNGAHRFYVFNRVVSGLWTAYLVLALAVLLFQLHRRKSASRALFSDAKPGP